MPSSSLFLFLWFFSSLECEYPFVRGALLQSVLASGLDCFVIVPRLEGENEEEGGDILQYDETIDDITSEWFSLDCDEDDDDFTEEEGP